MMMSYADEREAEQELNAAIDRVKAAKERLELARLNNWAARTEPDLGTISSPALGERIADCARAHIHGETDGPWMAMRRAIAALVARATTYHEDMRALDAAVREYLRFHDANLGDDYFDADRRRVRMPVDTALEATKR